MNGSEFGDCVEVPAGSGRMYAVIQVDDLDGLVTKLQGGGVTFISPQVVSVSGEPWTKALMVKDPDGHAVLLVE